MWFKDFFPVMSCAYEYCFHCIYMAKFSWFSYFHVVKNTISHIYMWIWYFPIPAWLKTLLSIYHMVKQVKNSLQYLHVVNNIFSILLWVIHKPAFNTHVNFKVFLRLFSNWNSRITWHYCQSHQTEAGTLPVHYYKSLHSIVGTDIFLEVAECDKMSIS